MERSIYDGPGSSVILTAIGSSRVQVLAAIRAARADLGLHEVQDLVRNLPQLILDDVSSDDARRLARALEMAGATVEVQREVIGTDVNEWLKKRVTVEEAEAAHQVDGMKPFGHSRDAWLDLRSLLLRGDELWTFCSPPINAGGLQLCKGERRTPPRQSPDLADL